MQDNPRLFLDLVGVAVSEQSSVRRDGLRLGISLHFPQQFALRGRPDLSVIREMHPAEEVDARCDCLYAHLVFVQTELQSHVQKLMELREQVFKILFVGRHDRKIVGVSDIVFHFQFLLEIHVELVHVNVHEKLRGQIAKR